MSPPLECVVRAGACLALVVLGMTSPAGATGTYTPTVETQVKTCGKAALTLHPGKITRTEVLFGEKTVRIEVHIRQRGGEKEDRLV